jgi:hypothetical protein
VNERLLVNDEPFFPIGYMYADPIWVEPELKKLAGGGVNCLVRWLGVVGGMNTTPESWQYITDQTTLAHRYGIKVFLPLATFGPMFFYSYGEERVEKAVNRLLEILPGALRRYRDLDGVIGYYGIDEPPPKFYDHARRMHRLLEEIDPYRILYSSNWRDWEPEGYELFDLLGRHGYWWPGGEFFSPRKLARRCIQMRDLAAQ